MSARDKDPLLEKLGQLPSPKLESEARSKIFRNAERVFRASHRSQSERPAVFFRPAFLLSLLLALSGVVHAVGAARALSGIYASEGR